MLKKIGGIKLYKFAYIINLNNHIDDVDISFKENILNKIYNAFIGSNRMVEVGDIKDERFKKIGKCIAVKDINDEKEIEQINKYVKKENIELICLERNMMNAHFFDAKVFDDEDIYFEYYIKKIKEEIKDRQDFQILLVIGRDTKYKYIKKVCMYFPDIVFYSKHTAYVNGICDKLYREEGISVYLSSSDKFFYKSDVVFDLTMEEIDIFKSEGFIKEYISLYNNKKGDIQARKKINNIKVRAENMKIEGLKQDTHDISFLGGVYANKYNSLNKDYLLYALSDKRYNFIYVKEG